MKSLMTRPAEDKENLFYTSNSMQMPKSPGLPWTSSRSLKPSGDNFRVGDKIWCTLQGSPTLAEIIEARPAPLDVGEFTDPQEEHGGLQMEYYVHYDNRNRRLDEWVTADRMAPYDTKGAPAHTSTTAASSRDSLAHTHTNGQFIAGHSEIDDTRMTRTRNMKRKFEESNHIDRTLEDLDPRLAALEKEHEDMTKIKYINKVLFGKYEIETWYFSPYPEDYGKAKYLYLCDKCLKYMKFPETLQRHQAHCRYETPPGTCIYKHESLQIFEVDGKAEPLFCQNLCLMAKLFLDHKTLFFDVDPFYFYLLYSVQPKSDAPASTNTASKQTQYEYELVGYFSKEKASYDSYNVACILTLPPQQRKGYGNFLIEFSYELSKLEKKIGSPEKPLSDLGKLSYRSFWCRKIMELLHSKQGLHQTILSVSDISDRTCFTEDDIISTMKVLNLVKFWKGQHIICVTPKIITDYFKSKEYKRKHIKIHPQLINWERVTKHTATSSTHHH